MKYLSLALLMAMLISGCATVEVAKDLDGAYVDGAGKAKASLAIENYGYYLFGVWPIIAGDPARPNENTCRFFTDTATLERNTEMLALTAQSLDAKALGDVRTEISWTGSFSLWIVWRKVIFTSGLVVEK